MPVRIAPVEFDVLFVVEVVVDEVEVVPSAFVAVGSDEFVDAALPPEFC